MEKEERMKRKKKWKNKNWFWRRRWKREKEEKVKKKHSPGNYQDNLMWEYRRTNHPLAPCSPPLVLHFPLSSVHCLHGEVLQSPVFCSILLSSYNIFFDISSIPMPSVTTCSLILKLFIPAQISLLTSKGLSPITNWTSLHRQVHINKYKHILRLPTTNSLPFNLYSLLGLKVSPSFQVRNVGLMLDFPLILALCRFSHCNFLWNQFPLGTFSLNPHLPTGLPATWPMPMKSSSIIRQMWYDPLHSLVSISRTLLLMHKIKLGKALLLTPACFSGFNHLLLFYSPAHMYSHPHSILVWRCSWATCLKMFFALARNFLIIPSACQTPGQPLQLSTNITLLREAFFDC